MSSLLPDSARRAQLLLSAAAKQSSRCHVIPVRLDSAIKAYLQEQELSHMKKKVLRLSQSFEEIKDVNRMLPASFSKELVQDPIKKGVEQSKRWKVKSGYGDVGLMYREDESMAYVASRMPAVYSACYRILKEIRRRVPGFSPVKVLDFGSGTGSAFWALRDVWPQTLERVNLIEPSQSMQRAGLGLLRDIKNLPLIHSYGTLQSLSKDLKKSERPHDLVIASYVLGEIPSLKDRITIVRQLWNLTGDILILIEPGTPEGSNIISVMRSHILWMERRKSLKRTRASKGASESSADSKDGAFIVAPCPHDGACPLANTGKYCHFVQRLERTETQRAYKKSGSAPLRGFEDEKFSYVAFRRGKRPQEPWPLDGIKFETLKEMRAKRNPEDLEIDYDDQFEEESDETVASEADPSSYDSDAMEESIALTEHEDEDEEEEEGKGEGEEEEEIEPAGGSADLGSGWGRIVFMPQRRGRRIEMDVCRATKRDGSEGSFEHLVITKSKNPALHRQARKSFWGDLWPF